MITVTERFLTIRLENLGYILDDSNVLRAIKKMRPFVLAEPSCPAAQCVTNIAQRLVRPEETPQVEVRKGFLHRMKELFNR